MGFDGHAIRLTRAKAAPLQRWLGGSSQAKHDVNKGGCAGAHPYRVSDFEGPVTDLGCCRRKDIKTRRPAATQMQLSATLKEGQA
jgi:hypothetical protein